MNDHSWAVRTIRDGRVKIGGYYYTPSSRHLRYDGRLDGKRYAFARYWEGDRRCPFVALWGTEEAFKKAAPAATDPSIVDGALPWMWWNQESTETEENRRLRRAANGHA